MIPSAHTDMFLFPEGERRPCLTWKRWRKSTRSEYLEDPVWGAEPSLPCPLPLDEPPGMGREAAVRVLGNWPVLLCLCAADPGLAIGWETFGNKDAQVPGSAGVLPGSETRRQRSLEAVSPESRSRAIK